jgi:hypothetical protein
VVLSSFVDAVLCLGGLPPPHLNFIILHKQHVETSTNERLERSSNILFECIDSLAGKHGFFTLSQSKEEELN